MDLSNPITLATGFVLLLAILYLWNKRNANKRRERKNRSFRNSYYQRKKDREKEIEK